MFKSEAQEMRLGRPFGISWTLIGFFAYLLVCYMASYFRPLHLFEFFDYFSTARARLFWILTTLAYFGGLFIHHKLYTQPKNIPATFARKMFLIYWAAQLYFFVFIFSFPLFEVINASRLSKQETQVKMHGEVKDKSVRKIRRFANQYFISVYSNTENILIDRQVTQEFYEQAPVGGTVSIKYATGLLGVAFQEGEFDSGEVENLTSTDQMDEEIVREAYNSKDKLAALGSSYSLTLKNNQYEARYCPDNTCEVIISSEKNGGEVVKDTSFLYFGTASDYLSLRTFQKVIPETDLSEVRGKYDYLCSEKISSTICILRGMIEMYKIKMNFVRFDEGKESKTLIKL
jgi:hypothetical protein